LKEKKKKKKRKKFILACLLSSEVARFSFRGGFVAYETLSQEITRFHIKKVFFLTYALMMKARVFTPKKKLSTISSHLILSMPPYKKPRPSQLENETN